MNEQTSVDLATMIAVASGSRGGRFGARTGDSLGRASGSGPAFYANSSTGSDANPGTQAQPWQTLTPVNAQTYAAGTTVFLQGSFSGTLTVSALAGGGTVGKPIKFTSYGAGQATITAAANTNGITSSADISNITIDNLNVVGSGGTSGRGIVFFNPTVNSANILISNCNVSGFAGDGIMTAATSTTTTITNHQIANCIVNACTTGLNSTTAGIRISGTYGAQVRGSYQVFSSGITNCTSKNNTGVTASSNWCGSGIFIGQGSGALITNCIADNNGANCNNAAGPTGIWTADSDGTIISGCWSKNTKTAAADGHGYDLDGGTTNCIIQNCYASDNAGFGIYGFMYDDATKININSGNIIRFNVSARNTLGAIGLISGGTHANNGQVYQNIFFTATGVAMQLSDNGGGLTQIIGNNIVRTSNAGTIDIVKTLNNPNCTLSGNDYFSTGAFRITWNGTAYSTYATWQTATSKEKILGANVGFNTDPLLLGTNPSSASMNMDLMRLNASSPLLNTGVNLFSNYGINPGATDWFGNSISTGGNWSVGIGTNRAAKMLVILNTAGSGNWTAAADCVSVFKGMCVGGGASNSANGTGAGGGAYAESLMSALPIVPGVTLVPYVVAAGGAAGGNGGDTCFGATSLANAVSIGALLCAAAQGGQTNATTTGGVGGLAANSVGSTKYNGGSGGNALNGFNGGGGGAAGPYGAGGNGGNGGPVGGGAGGGGGADGGGNGVPGSATNGGLGGKSTFNSGQGSVSSTNGGAGTGGAGGSGAGNTGGVGGAGGAGIEFVLSGTNYGPGGGGGADAASGTATNIGALYGGGGGGRATNAPGGSGLIAVMYDTTATLA